MNTLMHYVKLVKSGLAVKSDEQLCTNLGEMYGHHVSIDPCGEVIFYKVLWVIVGMVQGRHFGLGCERSCPVPFINECPWNKLMCYYNS